MANEKIFIETVTAKAAKCGARRMDDCGVRRPVCVMLWYLVHAHPCVRRYRKSAILYLRFDTMETVVSHGVKKPDGYRRLKFITPCYSTSYGRRRVFRSKVF